MLSWFTFIFMQIIEWCIIFKNVRGRYHNNFYQASYCVLPPPPPHTDPHLHPLSHTHKHTQTHIHFPPSSVHVLDNEVGESNSLFASSRRQWTHWGVHSWPQLWGEREVPNWLHLLGQLIHEGSGQRTSEETWTWACSWPWHART